MLPALIAAGEAVAGGAAAVGAWLGTTQGAAVAVGAAGGFAAKQVAKTAAAGALATTAVAGAVPWVVAGLTVWQLGKLGCKLLEGDDKK